MSVYRDQGYAGGDPMVGPYDSTLDEIREADLGSRHEFVLRYLVVTTAGLALFYATGASVMLLWLGAYLVANATYSWTLYNVRGPVHRPLFASFIAGNIISSTIFLSMPLYLFTQVDNHALRALAVAGMVGHAMFNLSRHTSRSPLVYWDICCIVGYCLFICTFEILRSDALGEQIVLAVAGLAVGGYYITAQLGTINAYERLEAARIDTAHDHKIRAVGRLTGGVAHDFNNLLTVIKGNLELYPEMQLKHEKDEVIAEAHKAATRATEVIAQLLSFSRQSRLAPARLDLHAWAEEIEILVSSLLPETIFQTVIVEPEIDEITVDRGQLSAAVMNLMINARDAMEGMTGNLKLEIHTVSGAIETVSGLLPDDTYVCFAVTDTGTGVDANALAHLSEPFFTTKPAGQGSGLGLSMARGFAEQSGGGLWVRSHPGHGTQVSLFVHPAPTPVAMS